MKKFAVIGNPIAHSKSPEIHLAFSTQFDIQLSYERLLAEENNFSTTVRRFFETGMGVNITVPFKESALQVAEKLSTAATLAGAVNTLLYKNNVIIGDNTDGFGLVRDICNNYGTSLTRKNILIIGAGGAARGAIFPIISEKPNQLVIANRTLKKAQILSHQFSHYMDIEVTTLDQLSTFDSFDIVINATSASLQGQGLGLPFSLFDRNTLAYDMMYGEQLTVFMKEAINAGATAVDGLGMLVEQAAKSFEIWHGVYPNTTPILEKMRKNKIVREN